ncbi:MAG: cytochrome c biogenesis protein CcsA [Fimbriimonadaceae bacterium]
MRNFAIILFGLTMAAATVGAFVVPDAQVEWQHPDLARIVFFHLPYALLSAVAIIVACWFAWKYLRTRDMVWDLRTAAAVELSGVLATITLLTGIVFSDVQWGKAWNWDPRQTSYLLVLLLIGAYLAIRSALPDRTRVAASSSAYLLAALLPILFLIFVYPRIQWSLHPDVVRQGGFDGWYRTLVLSMFGLVGVWSVWAYRLRVRAGVLNWRLEELESNGKLEADRHGAAVDRVVRPVRVHVDDRSSG